MSLEVRRAIYQKLAGTTAVTSLLSGTAAIYHGQAPPDAAYPFIIFNKQSKSRDRAFDKTTAFENEIWMIKAVDRNSTSNRAESISEAVEAELTNGTLSVSGKTVEDLYPTGDVDYLETDGDQTFRHHGVMYRIVLT